MNFNLGKILLTVCVLLISFSLKAETKNECALKLIQQYLNKNPETKNVSVIAIDVPAIDMRGGYPTLFKGQISNEAAFTGKIAVNYRWFDSCIIPPTTSCHYNIFTLINLRTGKTYSYDSQDYENCN